MHKKKKLTMLLALKTGQRVHILGAFDPYTDMYMNCVKKKTTHFGDPDCLSSWRSFILQLLKLIIVHYVHLKPAQILGNHSTFT